MASIALTSTAGIGVVRLRNKFTCVFYKICLLSIGKYYGGISIFFSRLHIQVNVPFCQAFLNPDALQLNSFIFLFYYCVYSKLLIA